MTSVQILKLEHLKKRSSLDDLPFQLRSMARKIETRSLNFTENELNFLEKFYKEIINENKPNLWSKIRGFLVLLYLLTKYDFDYILDLTEAANQLSSALTDLVEQNNSSYITLIQNVLDAAKEPGKELTSEEMNAIFREVESNLH